MGDIIVCPECASSNWRCWDERDEWYQDTSTGEFYRYPTGYLLCKDCGYHWIDPFHAEDIVWIGDDHDAGLC